MLFTQRLNFQNTVIQCFLGTLQSSKPALQDRITLIKLEKVFYQGCPIALLLRLYTETTQQARLKSLLMFCMFEVKVNVTEQ